MLDVLGSFRIVFKSIRRHYQSVERRAGISGAQLWALAQVAENPGLLVGDLARALAVHQSTASNLLRDLESSALLMRRRLREDQRSVRLFATSKGRSVLKRAPRPFIGVLQQALSDLPAGNLDALHSQLNRLIAAMQSRDSQARATPLSEL
jgi:DNA-binding MarR family transcriptional regulator